MILQKKKGKTWACVLLKVGLISGKTWRREKFLSRSTQNNSNPEEKNDFNFCSTMKELTVMQVATEAAKMTVVARVDGGSLNWSCLNRLIIRLIVWSLARSLPVAQEKVESKITVPMYNTQFLLSKCSKIGEFSKHNRPKIKWSHFWSVFMYINVRRSPSQVEAYFIVIFPLEFQIKTECRLSY